MAAILIFTILGFLIGLSFVMVKRRIRPGPILAATFLGLFAAGLWKAVKEYSRNKGRRRYY